MLVAFFRLCEVIAYYGRERILYAMMQLLQQQSLQTGCSLLLGGIDSRFCQQLRGVYPSLRQHLTETDVLRFERLFFRGRNLFGHLTLVPAK